MAANTGYKATSDRYERLREIATQSLKKNQTPMYTPDIEGGVMAGPLTKKDMEKQAETEDKQYSD